MVDNRGGESQMYLTQSNVIRGLAKVKSGDYGSKAVRLPYYREKGGLFNLILSTNAITIKNGFLTVPMSREYMKHHNGHRIRIPVPDRLKDKKIKEVRICPMYGGRYFKIQYCYLQDSEPVAEDGRGLCETN